VEFSELEIMFGPKGKGIRNSGSNGGIKNQLESKNTK